MDNYLVRIGSTDISGYILGETYKCYLESVNKVKTDANYKDHYILFRKRAVGSCTVSAPSEEELRVITDAIEGATVGDVTDMSVYIPSTGEHRNMYAHIANLEITVNSIADGVKTFNDFKMSFEEV